MIDDWNSIFFGLGLRNVLYFDAFVLDIARDDDNVRVAEY